MRLPNFLIIGANKAGTTTLYDQIRQHPDVFMPRLKEPRFFTYDGRENDTRIPVRTFEDYVALFAPAGTQSALGEASPFYLNHPRAPERIHAALPGVRLIVSLRNPIERSFSLYQMNLREHGANRGLSFVQAFRQDRVLQKGYAIGLARFFARFEREQLLVLLFEDIVRAPRETLQRTFGFLGVDPEFVPVTFAVSNPGGLPRIKFVHALSKNRKIQALGRLLPEALVMRARDLRNRNLKKQGMTEEDQAVATVHFREDILKVQDMIGRDLSSWLRV